MAYRKQGPVLPTLAISLSDKEKKRRSSRAGFMSKDSNLTTLYFRTPPDDLHISLHDWARYIVSRKAPMSPDSPVSPSFSNPFTPRSREAPEYFPPRPGSGSNSNRTDCRPLHHKSSTATYSTGVRERPATISTHSPSLRSKRSDVSSSVINFSASQSGHPIPGQHYTSVLPADMPSPITSMGDFKGEFIEGWTSAQGRSSTMSSPRQGRDSLSSQAAQPPIVESSSPPGPRETILDRAFQLKYIPGTDQDIPGEDKLTSLARFDALMREADEKRRQREAVQYKTQQATRSAFEADDSTDASRDSASSTSDSDSDYYAHEQDGPRSPTLIPPSAQRALDFVAGRREPAQTPASPRPGISRTPLSFHADQTPNALMQPTPPIRPQTAHSKSRPNAGTRTQSNPYMTATLTPTPSVPWDDDSNNRHRATKRQSSSSAKRLSFTEFTKRLSSSSSLLLVQTNASGGSSQRSSEVDDQSASLPRTSLNPRGSGIPPPIPKDRNEPERKCGWRNSVIGTDGGFL
jgi:hypothetical protein